MFIYHHEYTAGSAKIKTRVIEVEEKNKIYVTKDRQRIFKAEIGRLKGGYFKEMYTLTADIKDFAKALFDLNKTTIEKRERELKELAEAQAMLAECINSNLSLPDHVNCKCQINT